MAVGWADLGVSAEAGGESGQPGSGCQGLPAGVSSWDEGGGVGGGGRAGGGVMRHLSAGPLESGRLEPESP